MNIDWSDAPDWANELALNPYEEQAWLGDDGYSYLMGNGGIVSWSFETAYDRSAFKIMQLRPRPSVWTGEGLPPVGTVCECRLPGELTNEYSWVEAKVIWHNGPTECAVVRSTSRLAWCDEFRPIRTSEQIAAEKREALIAEIAKEITSCMPYRPDVLAKALHDAGYRKQVSE